MVLLMTTFTDASGNLLHADVDALVNTVNTVGVMGKGIALQFKNTFPANFKAYEQACKGQQVRLGEMFVFDAGQFTRPRWIINFPTKGHWRSRSRIADVAMGLDDLRRVITELSVRSIAVPPLGCGNGGLDWADVRPLIEAKLAGLDLDVYLYSPTGSPAAANMTVATPRPELTRAKAALVAMVDRYTGVALAASLIEIQKLMYFLQEVGEELKLRYEAHRYGPYADNLRHVLKALEGHYLQGFGDGSTPVQEAEPIKILSSAAEEAEAALGGSSKTSDRVRCVLELVDGYESPYGLELLASAHWVATHHREGSTSDIHLVIERVQGWSRRKERMFTNEHVATAWDRLCSKGWVDMPAPA